MAFESIVSYMILFSVGIGAIVAIAVFYNNYLVTTTRSLDDKQDLLEKKNSALIHIENVSLSSAQSKQFLVNSESDFNEGIFYQTNETIVSGSVVLDLDGLDYYSDGYFISDIYDLSHPVDFTSLASNGQRPAPTFLGVQMRSANSSAELVGEFLGPDGTNETYYGLLDTTNSVHDGDKVIQFKVTMTTSDVSQTPQLDNITLNYKYMYDDLSIVVLNDGSIKIPFDNVDIFIDDDRIERNYVSLSKYVLDYTEIRNPSIWDPEEFLELKLPYNMTSGNHIIRLVTEYGTADNYIYRN
jgi:hypothetical protein